MLAPERAWLALAREEYKALYEAWLTTVDADAVVPDVRALVYPHDPILLCWQKRVDIEAGETWCHRHLVAPLIERSSALKSRARRRPSRAI